MTLHHEGVTSDAEERIANLLRAFESDKSDAAEALRWAVRNWLRARRGLADVANLTPDRDIQAVIADALAVDDTI